MQVRHWLRFALFASIVWVIVGGLLASRNESWAAAWKLYCSLAADPTCAGDTVFLVMHWDAVAGVVFYPLVLIWLVVWGFVALRRRTRGS